MEAVEIFARVVRQILNDSKESGNRITQQELANALGISKQGFTNKMTRDSFTDEDMYRIASHLNMRIIIKGEKEYELKEDWDISSFFYAYSLSTQIVYKTHNK